jgi:hypothetical protein
MYHISHSGLPFKGMNWDNMLVAGGSVIACLKSVPVLPEGQEASFSDVIEKLYRESDIDIFLYGLSPGTLTVTFL